MKINIGYFKSRRLFWRAMPTLRSERGFVLILALVSMVAMTVIGISLIMNMTTDLQLARNERESKLAFQLADAGINEAMARLKLNLTPSPPYVGEPNPPAGTSNVRTTAGWAGQSFNGSDGLGYGVNVTYLTEGLPYCDSNAVAPNTSGNMTVDANGNPVTSPDARNCNNEVVMFGRDFGLATTLTSIRLGTNPVYKIVSTGTSGTTTRQIEAYVGASSLNTDTDSGLNTNGCVSVSGASTSIGGGIKQDDACGCDAQLETALGAGASDCTSAANELKTTGDNLDTYLGGDSLADIEAMANEVHNCTTLTCSGAGDDIPSSGMIDGVVQDWGDAAGDTRSTIIYVNNPSPGSNDVKISGNFSGRGILVITGNLILSGSLTYEGLVYVKGTITVSGGGGGLNVTGGVMAGGLASLNGNVTINYDQATLAAVGRQNSGKALIVWRRL